jgi:hypothetical protein
VQKLFDLDLRFRDMDEIGDYRQIISLPKLPAKVDKALDSAIDCHTKDNREKPRANCDVNEAAKNIGMMDLAEAAVGMYKKPLEVLARDVHYEPLPPEVRAVVITAWIRGDMLPKTAIEQMIPAVYSSSPA